MCGSNSGDLNAFMMMIDRYLRQARQHVCMILLVEGYKGQLNVQQLCVGLWQLSAACHKEHKLLLQLNVPAIHNLYHTAAVTWCHNR